MRSLAVLLSLVAHFAAPTEAEAEAEADADSSPLQPAARDRVSCSSSVVRLGFGRSSSSFGVNFGLCAKHCVRLLWLPLRAPPTRRRRAAAAVDDDDDDFGSARRAVVSVAFECALWSDSTVASETRWRGSPFSRLGVGLLSVRPSVWPPLGQANVRFRERLRERRSIVAPATTTTTAASSPKRLQNLQCRAHGIHSLREFHCRRRRRRPIVICSAGCESPSCSRQPATTTESWPRTSAALDSASGGQPATSQPAIAAGAAVARLRAASRCNRNAPPRPTLKCSHSASAV